mmetsp:Transcript_142862/g.397981  ORF Transcript_142862/g.397981 Transcript_142862/m.397981 type:complete len:375 (+) Transcript_142862:309-1433(+)
MVVLDRADPHCNLLQIGLVALNGRLDDVERSGPTVVLEEPAVPAPLERDRGRGGGEVDEGKPQDLPLPEAVGAQEQVEGSVGDPLLQQVFVRVPGRNVPNRERRDAGTQAAQWPARALPASHWLHAHWHKRKRLRGLSHAWALLVQRAGPPGQRPGGGRRRRGRVPGHGGLLPQRLRPRETTRAIGLVHPLCRLRRSTRRARGRRKGRWVPARGGLGGPRLLPREHRWMEGARGRGHVLPGPGDVGRCCQSLWRPAQGILKPVAPCQQLDVLGPCHRRRSLPHLGEHAAAGHAVVHHILQLSEVQVILASCPEVPDLGNQLQPLGLDFVLQGRDAEALLLQCRNLHSGRQGVRKLPEGAIELPATILVRGSRIT